MIITTIDRKACATINEQAMQALQAVASEFGLVLSAQRSTFDPNGGFYDMKMRFSCRSADGIPTDFARNAPLCGLEAGHFGMDFVSDGKTYRISGINLRAKKFPVRCEGPNGRTYKFPSALVCSLVKPLGGAS